MRNLPALILLFAACGTRGRLIENYEVLRVPVAAAQYEAGRGWNSAIGAPDTPRPADLSVATQEGVTSLETTTDRTALDFKLAIPVIDWLGGKLGLKSTERLTLKLRGLKHQSVQDARQLRETHAVLWEAVTADGIDLTIDTSGAAELDLTGEALGKKLAEGADPASLTVKRNSTGKYVLSSSRPLVIAIRVVELEWRTGGGDTPLDLSSGGKGREQPAALGYRVMPMDPLVPTTDTVRLSIRNPGFPQWTGTTFLFDGAATSWVNGERGLIASSDDPQLKDARFVWDSMRVLWAEDLASSRLSTTRQYVRLKTVKSGLSGTR